MTRKADNPKHRDRDPANFRIWAEIDIMAAACSEAHGIIVCQFINEQVSGIQDSQAGKH